MTKTKISSAFTSWIFNSFRISPEGLGLYRIFCGLFLLIFLFPSPRIYKFISALPNDFFLPPPGPMMLFSGFPPYVFFLFLHILLIVSLILMVLGWQTKVMSLLSGIVLLVLKGFIYSLGKINHDLLIIIVLLVMSFSGWGKAYSVDSYVRLKKVKLQEWPFTLLALLIGFMFFTAGFSKLIGGWLLFNSQATLGHVFRQFFVYGRQDLLAGYATQVTAPVIWEIFDYMTVIFEMGFLIAIFHPRTTRIFVCLAVLFHFGIMMTLNIGFLPNFIAYAAFLNWTWINNKLKNKPVSSSNSINYWIPAIAVSLSLVAIWLLALWLSTFDLLHSDLKITECVVLTLSVPIALFYITKQAGKVWKRA